MVDNIHEQSVIVIQKSCVLLETTSGWVLVFSKHASKHTLPTVDWGTEPFRTFVYLRKWQRSQHLSTTLTYTVSYANHKVGELNMLWGKLE